MKATLKEIWSCQRALGKLAKVSPIPIKTSYWVANRTKKLMKEIEEVEAKRLELVKKYGEEESGTKQVSVSEENMQKFSDEFNELLSTEIEVDIQKFSIEDFPNCTSLLAEDFIVLSFLFNEPNEAGQEKPVTPRTK